MNKISALFISILSLFLFANKVSAHVVIKPDTVGVAAFQTFTVDVPNEKDNPMVGLRLVIPDGLKSVSPNVKPQWKIEIKKTGEGEDAKITEVDWTGGSIPEGQRDDFLFSAQVPATETTLLWKAYQMYQNGDVISWDQAPMKNMSDEDREKTEKTGKGPYSETKIINDLKNDSEKAKTNAVASNISPLSLVSLVLSVVAIGIASRKK